MWERRKNYIVNSSKIELKHTSPNIKIVLEKKLNQVQFSLEIVKIELINGSNILFLQNLLRLPTKQEAS